MSEQQDPWADLADSLGAKPGSEPSPQPAPRPAPPKPERSARPANQRSKETSWANVADDLGVSKPAGQVKPEDSAPPSPAARPAVPQSETPKPPPTSSAGGFGAGLLGDEPAASPPRTPSRRPASNRSRRVGSEPVAHDRSSAGPSADDGREQPVAEDEDKSGVPRPRRRGRRGGRGRRGDRRDREEAVAPADVEGLPGYGHNLDEERQTRKSTNSGHRADVRPHSPWEDESGRGLDTEANSLLDAEGDEESRPASGGRTPSRTRASDAKEEGGSDGEGERRRRRRRRGRRSRNGESAERSAEPRSDRSSQDESLASDSLKGDATSPRGDGVSERGEEEAEPRRRRRRRRRRSTSDEGSESGTERSVRKSSEEKTEPRRRSARGGRRRDDRRSGEADGRRRRETFSRVGDGRDEDEGLEFLGMDEPTVAPDNRRSSDDEMLAESGLDDVRDVPSWVEAIGIVIAGNMDSRKQPPKS